MKQFFKLHAELVLVGMAVIMLGILVGGFVWAIIFVTKNIGLAVNPTPGDTTHTTYNLEGAKALNFHGLREITISTATSSASVASSSAP
ncbi:MAG: hypothetical protein Q7S28_00670 [bacterium]|nr:hypothetical protein [bacterium]